MSDIVAYLDLYGYSDPEYRQSFFHYIDALDDVWLRWARDATDKDKK